jgi:creatinine amidohydrolase/Fe(II)-dependent formamide hydrolase-like protein
MLLLAGFAWAAPAPAARVPSPAAPQRWFLEDFTWTELRDAIAAGTTTAIVPIGGTEQSGPAIALGKHNARVRLLSERIAQALGNAIVAPLVAFVPEGNIDPPTSHMRFAGTISVPPAVFEAQLEAIARSLRASGFRDIVLLGDHGGYQAQLGQVAARLNREWSASAARVHAPTAYYRAATEGFARLLRQQGVRDDEIGTHAALADTALQLAVDPAMVRTDVLQSGARLDAGVGVYGGDPRRATAALGQAGLDLIVRDTVPAIRASIAAARRGPAGAASKKESPHE